MNPAWPNGKHTGNAGAVLCRFAAACLFAATVVANAAESLEWRTNENRVDAEIRTWDVTKLLEQIAAVTDWQIYLEPRTKHTVSTKFKGRPPGEALRLLLGELSFALLPQTNGPSKLFVFKTTLQEATQLIRAPDKSASKAAKPIPNELLVKLKPGASIEELAKKLGAKIIGRADGLNTYRLQFEDQDATDAARTALKSNNDVDNVDYNYPVFHEPAPDPLSFSSTPGINLRPKVGGDGSRLIVGMIDTPIHPQGGVLDEFLLPTVSVVGNGKATGDQITHADSMSQTILRGIAAVTEGNDGSSVRILPVDVYGNSPSTSTWDVGMGILKAIESGGTIMSLSLGSEGDTTFLRQIIKNAHDQGVLFLAAAGNQPVTTPTYPAAYPEVIAVTAGNSSGQIAAYANRGSFVDIVAPGSTIVTYGGQTYLVSGTSASTAFAAGAAAGLADKSGRKSAEVAEMLRLMLAPKAKP